MFAALLAVPPDPGDPLTAQVRAQRAAVAVLRAVASPNRPLVVFLDDLQWAGRTALGVVDLRLSEEPTEDLLLAGAYREGMWMRRIGCRRRCPGGGTIPACSTCGWAACPCR